MGTKTDIRPTPIPANTRPTTKRGMASEAVCIATPIEKTAQAETIPHLRPRISATGAPNSAPDGRGDEVF